MTNAEFIRRCFLLPCRHCKATKGNPCVDKRGRRAGFHSDRRESVMLEVQLWERRKFITCPLCKGRGRFLKGRRE